ncbi:hypothetical protein I3V64_10670 [Staphylococcus haemolyticus]|uniref:Cthe_2314 family HEPN domain-containing protein n=1 Tax=Staphylococcus TaxID=1279 RepID=UPI00187ACA10|nr:MULTISPECIES: Cthe_2314 family HEPN domain-containing protein [Staphylococcus]HDG3406607.1 hypothetical protein [Staphylococcus aureus]MBE7351946.1 hypothetical protein [Staphylococcus epidermidis]MBE9452779.1 hypothetical protein [Staphylococcus epidermidis]MBF9289577.1 hypothetical protein [Staphylococcus haemolyticus]HEG9958358.1 hypothetical protein [Staphylococcus aureus]
MTIIIKPLEDIESINMRSLLKEAPFDLDILKKKEHFENTSKNVEEFLNYHEISYWVQMLYNRLNHLLRNYCYSIYYYNKEIPDEQWYKSPGSNGESIEYFPYFKDSDYSNWYNFRYFSEYFFLQGFSIFELIGNLIIKKYNIKLKDKQKPSFHNAVQNLEPYKFDLYKKLKIIKDSSNFKKIADHRNNIVHNEHPQFISSGITYHANGMTSAGVGNYTPTSEVKILMDNLLKILEDIIVKILNHNEENDDYNEK